MENKEFETVLKFMEHTDKLNKRLTNTIICVAIVFGITVISMCGLYFLSDYQYPTTEQAAIQGDQKLNQSIK